MSETRASSENKAQGHDEDYVIRVRDSFGSIDRAAWQQLAGTAPGIGDVPYNPFVSHPFLNALEMSGCATADTGWLAQHMTLEEPGGGIVAALPCYLKSHSQGEYVFDHGWADAYERAGGRYYPKLQCSVPFTPVTGPRLLVSPRIDAAGARQALANGLKALTERLGVSSAHVTFATEADIAALSNAGFLHRTDQQFHFRNEGYADFDAFLDTLSSRKRKNIRKERRTALVERHFHRVADRQ